MKQLLRGLLVRLVSLGQHAVPAYLLLVLLLPALSPLVGGYAEERVGLASPGVLLYASEWRSASSSLRARVTPWSINASSGGSTWFYAVGYLGEEPQFYNISIGVNAGNGSFRVEGRVDAAFVFSTRIAGFLSSLVAGRTPWSIDYNVSIAPLWGSSPLVGGPSASLPMTLSMMRLMGLEVNMSGMVFTGAVSLDGLVVPVGGLDVKYRGVRERGLGVLVYGEGSEYKFREYCNVTILGPYVFRGCSRGFLPVLEVNGTPVMSVFELLGVERVDAWSLLGEMELGDGSCSLLRTLYAAVEESTLRLISRARGLLDQLVVSGVYPEEGLTLLSLSLRYLVAAREAVDRGYCLLAADYYGYALEYAIRSLGSLLVNGDGVVWEARRLASMYRILYTDYLTRINNGDGWGVQRLLAYSLASLYAVEAWEAYSRGERLYSITQLVGTSRELLRTMLRYYAESAAGYVRAVSVLYMAERIHDDMVVDREVLARVVDYLVDIGDAAARYAALMSSGSRVSSPLPALASAYLERAVAARDRGDYVLALGYAVKSLSLSMLFMALYPGMEDLYRGRFDWVVYSSAAVGDPYCLPCRLFVEKLLYNRGASPASLLRDAESLYAWSIANRLLELAAGER